MIKVLLILIAVTTITAPFAAPHDNAANCDEANFELGKVVCAYLTGPDSKIVGFMKYR